MPYKKIEKEIQEETQKRAVHRPITVTIHKVTKLPFFKELPHETEITINLKMDKNTALAVIEEINRQIGLGDFVDLVAITVTGTS